MIGNEDSKHYYEYLPGVKPVNYEYLPGVKPVRSVFNLDQIKAMQMVVGQFPEVGIRILANPGETYTSTHGIDSKLGENQAYVEISGFDPNKGLTSFYEAADQLAKENEKNQQSR